MFEPMELAEMSPPKRATETAHLMPIVCPLRWALKKAVQVWAGNVAGTQGWQPTTKYYAS